MNHITSKNIDWTYIQWFFIKIVFGIIGEKYYSIRGKKEREKNRSNNVFSLFFFLYISRMTIYRSFYEGIERFHPSTVKLYQFIIRGGLPLATKSAVYKFHIKVVGKRIFVFESL